MGTKLPERITVVIPPQKEFHLEKYGDQQGCYLCDELNKKGYKDVWVGGLGFTRIEGVRYDPTTTYDATVVRNAFAKKKSIKLTLVKRQL